MENVIQKYLRNEFETIEEYNVQAGEVAEPFRVLVVANFPVNFSEAAARRLVEHRRQRRPLRRLHADHGRHQAAAALGLPAQGSGAALPEPDLAPRKAGSSWRDREFAPVPAGARRPARRRDVHPAAARRRPARPSDAHRVEVPFEFIAPAAERLLDAATAARGIDVPLGRAGATKLQHLRLGQGHLAARPDRRQDRLGQVDAAARADHQRSPCATAPTRSSST